MVRVLHWRRKGVGSIPARGRVVDDEVSTEVKRYPLENLQHRKCHKFMTATTLLITQKTSIVTFC